MADTNGTAKTTSRVKLYLYLYCNVITGLLYLQHSLLQVEAADSTTVKFLPGFKGPLPFELETGYIGVDKGENVQLFYYFVKSYSDYQIDPLVLWMTGGPGCSALTAFAYEIGPIAFEEVFSNGDVPRLVLNPYSWTQEASIVFVDAPVGAGFSYPRSPEAFRSTGLQTCNQIYQFLKKFLVHHPEFLSNPLYVGGDSYTGLFIPVVAELIAHGNENGIEPSINLKGYVLGNPLTTPYDEDYQVPFTHGMGIISDELYESLKLNCNGVYHDVDPTNTKCLNDIDTFKQVFHGIRRSHILQPYCVSVLPEQQMLSNERQRSLHENNLRILDVLNTHHTFRCRTDGYIPAYYWANDDRVHEALHIHKGSIKNWVRCNRSLPFEDSIRNVVPYHANLSKKGYRSLIYSGDHDAMVPFMATQAWIRSLNYSIVDEWRQWIVEGQVAGFVLYIPKVNNNSKLDIVNSTTVDSTWNYPFEKKFDFALKSIFVKGGGHTAPENKPKECKAMFKRWITHKPL